MLIEKLSLYIPNFLKFIESNEDYSDIYFLMILLLKYRPDVFEHSIRVSEIYQTLTRLLPNSMWMNTNEYIIGAVMHDIGKVAISKDILYKRGPLSAIEFEEVKKHAFLGRVLIDNLDKFDSVKELIELHHERWDGNGYPKRLKADEIPIACRVLTVCDSIEAMTSKRVYKAEKTYIECLDELKKNAGKQFDPILIEHVIELFDDVFECCTKLKSSFLTRIL